MPVSTINNPAHYAYWVARAKTPEEWRAVNNRLHSLLEARQEYFMTRINNAESHEEREQLSVLFNTDEHTTTLNALCTLSHEIITMRGFMEQALNLKDR